MVLRTVGLQLVVVLHQLPGEGLGVLDDLSSVLLERGIGSLLEGNSDACDGVVVWAALAGREERR